MSAPFPFESLILFGLLSALLLIGVALRASLGLFQKLLFPASLIGGTVGFVLFNLELFFGRAGAGQVVCLSFV